MTFIVVKSIIIRCKPKIKTYENTIKRYQKISNISNKYAREKV